MLITLTTDFGYQDAFVGVMKGVVAGINPKAQVVDLTHGIPAQDVMAAALILRHAVGYFPRGTIHVAVVDPGVGSARKPLLIEADGNYFIGPDNGIFSLTMEGKTLSRIVHLSNPATFQPPRRLFTAGFFAPVASLLVSSAPANSSIRIPSSVSTAQMCAVNANRREFSTSTATATVYNGSGMIYGLPSLAIALGPVRVKGLAPSYASAGAGDFIAVINSWGLLEISVYKESAQRLSGAKIGDRVRINWNG